VSQPAILAYFSSSSVCESSCFSFSSIDLVVSAICSLSSLYISVLAYTDLYDGGGKNAIPFDKIEAFYREYLK